MLDRLRKLAMAMVKPSLAIVMEDLIGIRGRRNGFAKPHLWCYRKLQRALANKAEENG